MDPGQTVAVNALAQQDIEGFTIDVAFDFDKWQADFSYTNMESLEPNPVYVITSYSIHYTKLYEAVHMPRFQPDTCEQGAGFLLHRLRIGLKQQPPHGQAGRRARHDILV